LDHISIIVRDLDKAIESYSSLLDVGPFSTYPPEYYRKYYSERTLRGKPANFTMKLSMAPCGPVRLELIEPVEGSSIYSEFLERKGEGLHHLGYKVKNMDATIRSFKKIGVDILMSAHGRATPTGFAYMDTEGMLGFVVEIFESNQYSSNFLKHWCRWDLRLPDAKMDTAIGAQRGDSLSQTA
jgi:hypothetical protein